MIDTSPLKNEKGEILGTAYAYIKMGELLKKNDETYRRKWGISKEEDAFFKEIHDMYLAYATHEELEAFRKERTDFYIPQR